MIVFFKKSSGIEKYLLVVITLFAIYCFILAWFNTLAHDDRQFLYLFNTYGFVGSIKYYYLSWQGRVSAYVFTNLTLMADRYFNGLFVWFLFLVIFFVSGIYFCVKNILTRSGIKFDPIQMILFSAYLFVFFQEIVYDKSTIFWLAASTSYYSGLAFLIAGVALVFSEGNSWPKFIFLLLVFLIVGCSLENLAFISLFFLIVFLTLSCFFTGNSFFYKNRAKTIVSIIGIGIGIAILMLCPGLEKRIAAFPNPDMITAIKITANSFYHFYKFMFLPELGKIILFSAPFIYLGIKLKPAEDLPSKKPFVKTVLMLISLLLAVVLLNFLIMAKGTGGMGQPRTLFHIAFFIVLVFSGIAFLAGYYAQVSKPVAQLLSLAALIVLLISLSQNYLRILPQSIKYSYSVKNRITMLQVEKSKGRTEAIVLDSLHYNQYVIYRSDEIAPDTTGEWNQTLKKELGIDFNISSVTANYSED